MTPIRLAATMAVFLLACGGPQDPAQEDLTAEEHEAEADREDLQAAEHEESYQRSGQVTYGADQYNPAESELAQAEEHRVHAQAHRDRADALRTFEDAECSRFSASARAACPFLLGLESVEDVEGGAKLVFGEAQDISAITDHIRCHLAFVGARGDEGIEDCALYVLGASVSRDENVITLVTDQPEQVPELRRRVRVQAAH